MSFFSVEERPDCSKRRCEVQFSPRCPEDSILIEGYAPPGECCPLPSRCVCSPAGCLRKVCQPGHLNILVSKSSGKPGECCDLYECKPGNFEWIEFSVTYIILLCVNERNIIPGLKKNVNLVIGATWQNHVFHQHVPQTSTNQYEESGLSKVVFFCGKTA